jgi:hypothetical protein
MRFGVERLLDSVVPQLVSTAALRSWRKKVTGKNFISKRH